MSTDKSRVSWWMWMSDTQRFYVNKKSAVWCISHTYILKQTLVYRKWPTGEGLFWFPKWLKSWLLTFVDACLYGIYTLLCINRSQMSLQLHNPFFPNVCISAFLFTQMTRATFTYMQFSCHLHLCTHTCIGISEMVCGCCLGKEEDEQWIV